MTIPRHSFTRPLGLDGTAAASASMIAVGNHSRTARLTLMYQCPMEKAMIWMPTHAAEAHLRLSRQ